MNEFDEKWWGVVVYSCFDSAVGTRAVASEFQRPLDPDKAQAILSQMNFQRGSVLHHRKQATWKGARTALVSACDMNQQFYAILHGGGSFHDRFRALRKLKAPQWGRTTCFDLLVRAGSLGVGGEWYRPDRAYLGGSTGPSEGFRQVWGITVTRSNAEQCERILRWWTENWDGVVRKIGTNWEGKPFDSADFENALCVFQDRKSVDEDASLLKSHC